MLQNFGISIILVISSLCILSCITLSQAQNEPLACNEATNMDIDEDQSQGIWWEVAVNPPPKDHLSCVQYDITPIANYLVVNIQFSNNLHWPWINQTNGTNVTLNNYNTQGYNITMNYLNTPPTTIKFLATDYTNYAFICGFQNISDVNSYFGIILTRERTVNATYLHYLEIMAAANYSQFLGGSMTKIYQQEACYDMNLSLGGGGGMIGMPFVSSILALVYAVLLWM